MSKATPRMTRRIKFKDDNGGTYVCLNAGLPSDSKIVKIRLDHLLGIGLVLFLLLAPMVTVTLAVLWLLSKRHRLNLDDPLSPAQAG
jgi:hypothetical protein